MQIKDLDHDLLLTHLILHNRKVAEEVAESAQWKEDGIINITVQFNGVEMPAEILEETLQGFVEQIETEISEAVDKDKFEEEVEKRAKQLLNDHADNALEQLCELQEKLYGIENVLTPYWSRK